jgi:LysM repeat protein
MPFLMMKAAAVAVAAGTLGTAGHAALAGNSQSTTQSQAVVRVYIVQSDDTLSKIARRFCGNSAAYPALARASGISNPNVIRVGQRITLACSGGSVSSSKGEREPDGDKDDHTGTVSGSNYAAGSAVIPATNSIYSEAGLARLWVAAGGSRGTAWHAACIAMHESTGKPWAISPTNDWGLWQIHNGGPAMLVPFDNAQRAVAMSNNGTNWSQWTTRGMC